MTILALLLRVGVTLLFLAMLLRLTGKRGWRFTRPLDLVIAILLGNLSRSLIMGRVSLQEGLLLIGTLAWVHLLVVTLAHRSTMLRTLFWGKPLVIAQQGAMRRQGLAREGIDAVRYAELLHLQRVHRLTDIDALRLEADGSPAIILTPSARRIVCADLDAARNAIYEEPPWRHAA